MSPLDRPCKRSLCLHLLCCSTIQLDTCRNRSDPSCCSCQVGSPHICSLRRGRPCRGRILCRWMLFQRQRMFRPRRAAERNFLRPQELTVEGKSSQFRKPYNCSLQSSLQYRCIVLAGIERPRSWHFPRDSKIQDHTCRSIWADQAHPRSVLPRRALGLGFLPRQGRSGPCRSWHSSRGNVFRGRGYPPGRGGCSL